MGIRIRKRIPNFVATDGVLPTAEVDSLAELKRLPWLAGWVANPKFRRFSSSDDHPMAEMVNGDFWAVAIILDQQGPIPWLPRWEMPPRWRARLAIDNLAHFGMTVPEGLRAITSPESQVTSAEARELLVQLESAWGPSDHKDITERHYTELVQYLSSLNVD